MSQNNRKGKKRPFATYKKGLFWNIGAILIKCSIVVTTQQDPYRDQDQGPRFQEQDQADFCDQGQDAKIETCDIWTPDSRG